MIGALLLDELLAHFIGPRPTVLVAGLTGIVATVVFVHYRRKLNGTAGESGMHGDLPAQAA